MTLYRVQCESTFLGHLKREANFALNTDGLLVVTRLCEHTTAFCEMLSEKSGEPVPEETNCVIAPCVWGSASKLWLGFMGTMQGYPGDQLMEVWKQIGKEKGDLVVTLWAFCFWNARKGHLVETDGMGISFQSGRITDAN